MLMQKKLKLTFSKSNHLTHRFRIFGIENTFNTFQLKINFFREGNLWYRKL